MELQESMDNSVAFVESASIVHKAEESGNRSCMLLPDEHLYASTFNEDSIDDDSYLDKEVSFWIDEQQREQEKRSVLNEAIANISDGRVSPIESSLQSPWQQISRTQKAYYLRKVRQVFHAVLSTIAPEQEHEIMNELKCCLDTDDRDAVGNEKKINDKELSILLAVYNAAESRQTRLQILSLFAKHFTKKYLKEMIPGLSNWQIDQARRHAVEDGPGNPVIPTPIKRTRLDPVKTNHFVNFIARPNFLQDVAFGKKDIKLDSGEKITIPNVIRTMVPSRIIKQYLCFCQETGFEPASERTLFRIIDVCAASTQKSLQGLDYFSTEGAQGFEVLENVIDKLEESGAMSTWAKEAKNILKETRRYLKTDYKSHIGGNEQCADHCTYYSLSDPQVEAFAKECSHAHDTSCDMCSKIDEILVGITKMISLPELHLSDQEQSHIRFDVEHATEAIYIWKAHLIRTVNQERAKQDTLNFLSDEKILVVMDWAMKYLPNRYREQMSDFYGKRGKSWHVSCIVHKPNDDYEVETIVHLFDSCTQDWFSVASILENVLVTVKQEHPKVKAAFLKSDNAGCYHNATLILTLKSIGERTGIRVQRYDFSDPQSGKDICDRKIAPMKGHIQRWVNENHNVLTAADMKQALESHGGVRGCRIVLAEVKVSKAATTEKWKGISSLFSFEFLQSGIRAWKAYGIGEGMMHLYDNIPQSKQGPTDLRIILPISSMDVSTKTGLLRCKPRKKKEINQEIFMCEEEGCVATFDTLEDYEAHLDTGRHIRVMERETVYDFARKKWAEKVTGVQSTHVGETGADHATANLNRPRKEPVKGWALKTNKKGQRTTEKVKLYLIEKFNRGVKTGIIIS